MRLLVICPHFEPDTAPTGLVVAAIAEQLRENGHRVCVVTSLPWYRCHRVEKEWRGRLVRTSGGGESAQGDSLSVTRVHPFPTSRTSIAARAVGFAGFTGLAALASLRPGMQPDGILAMSPPITLGLAGWLAARRWRVPLVLNAQDLYPDAVIQLGAVRSRWLIAAAHWLERLVYRCSDAVTVLSDDMRDSVKARVDPGWRTLVRVIPNFADTERIRPGDRMTGYRVEHGLGDRTVVMYAGNVGMSQPLSLMVDAARALRHRRDAVFVINGAGSALPALKAEAAGLDNLVFADFQPEERLSEVLASADVHTVLLRDGLARSSVPSKLYSIMAAGRPVVASLDAGTEVARVLQRSDSGLWVPPEDADAFIAAVNSLLNDSARRQAMGRNGRVFAESWASSAAAAQAYSDLYGELVRGAASRRRGSRAAAGTSHPPLWRRVRRG